jgi:hypothetical protein
MRQRVGSGEMFFFIFFFPFVWRGSTATAPSSDYHSTLGSYSSSHIFTSEMNGDQVDVEEIIQSSTLGSSDSPSRRCNIQTISLSNPYPNERTIHTLPHIPILYKGLSSRNSPLMNLSAKERLLLESGDSLVTLSSSNTYSHDKILMTLREYIETMNSNPNTDQSNETYYLFGNNHGKIWETFTNLYHLPPFPYCQTAGAVTIGLGGRHSGVSFHYHGPGFAEVIHGSKKFFLYPPSPSSSLSQKYGFHPNMTQVEWYETIYPTILLQQQQRQRQQQQQRQQEEVSSLQRKSEERKNKKSTKNEEDQGDEENFDDFYECEIFPGDILYFPDQWYHGTLNMQDYNFFVSVFIDPQLIKDTGNKT